MSNPISDLRDFLSESPSVVFPQDVLEYLPAIEAENAKLRELVVYMWDYVKGYADSLDAELCGYSWPDNSSGCGAKVRCGLGEFIGFPKRMQELGIEVD